MSRDELRKAIFSEKVESEVVELPNGQQIEVRDSSAGDMIDAVEVKDLKARMVRMLIMCCYVPGTDEKVFEDADKDSLMSLPSGGTYRKLIEAISKRANIDERAAEAGNDSGQDTLAT